jgi:hypothetical protein
VVGAVCNHTPDHRPGPKALDKVTDGTVFGTYRREAFGLDDVLDEIDDAVKDPRQVLAGHLLYSTSRHHPVGQRHLGTQS